MWRNDTKYEYMFMFPLKNLAHKGLIIDTAVVMIQEYREHDYSV